VAAVVLDTEVLFNQVGHPFTSPQRRLITQFFGPFFQQFHQPYFLLLAEAWQPACAPGLTKCLFASLLVLFPPAAHRLIADFQAAPNVAVVQLLAKQPDSLQTSSFECIEVTFYSTRVAHFY
jgi:hypothetical protein